MPDQHIIVAIGGSAGSLEALRDFFDHTPSDHASYVIIRHMPEGYRSQLKPILQYRSHLRIVEVVSTIVLERNTVYIAPADKNLVLKDGTLHLEDKKATGANLSVDRFFSSLAEEAIGKNAIAVVLSGSGMDGSKGVRLIKAAGGMVIAQDPVSCISKYMPEHAIESGCVDHIAIPSDIPLIIEEYTRELV